MVLNDRWSLILSRFDQLHIYMYIYIHVCMLKGHLGQSKVVWKQGGLGGLSQQVVLHFVPRSIKFYNNQLVPLPRAGEVRRWAVVPERDLPLPDPSGRPSAVRILAERTERPDGGASGRQRLWQVHHHTATREVLRPRQRMCGRPWSVNTQLYQLVLKVQKF